MSDAFRDPMTRELWLRYFVEHHMPGQRYAVKAKAHDLCREKLADIAEAAFTYDSLDIAKQHCTPHSTFYLRKTLNEYLAKQGEAAPGQGWDDGSLDGRDRVTIDIWRQWRADGFTGTVPGHTVRERYTQFLSVQRQYLPRVFRYICHNDPEAADIAVSNGWQVDPSAMRIPTPEEIAAVEARVREAIAAGPLYQQSGGKLAPDAPIPVKPRHLDAATLDRINPLPGGAKRHAATPAATDRPIDEPVSAARVAKPDPSAGDGQTGEPTVSAVSEAAGPAWHEARPVNEP